MNWTAATSKEAVLLNCAVPIFGSILLFCELFFFLTTCCKVFTQLVSFVGGGVTLEPVWLISLATES